MATREIYEVYAKVVDSNGAYNTLSGYPKAFDSNSYDGDIDKARARAYGEYHTVLGTMYKRDDRQIQLAMILRASDGIQIECAHVGKFPEPEPTPEPEA